MTLDTPERKLMPFLSAGSSKKLMFPGSKDIFKYWSASNTHTVQC